MRLIDADEFSEKMYRNVFEVDDFLSRWDRGLWVRYKLFEQTIEDCKTIDAEPIRHGKWTEHFEEVNGQLISNYECSVCKDWWTSVEEYNYCPNCGAKMNGVETE